MGLKSYFRKPVDKPVETPDVVQPTIDAFALRALTSRSPSSPDSADAQVAAMQRLHDTKYGVMVNHIWSQQAQLLWYSGGDDEGVLIKSGRDKYVCCPPDLERPDGFFEAIKTLNVKSAMTVNTRVIRILMENNDGSSIPIRDDLRIQVLPNISYLSRCAKHQFAAFIADRGILVVWDDQPENLVKRVDRIEKGLMAMIWSIRAEEDYSEKENKAGNVSVHELDINESEEGSTEKPRRIVLLHSITTALTLCLIIVTLGAGIRKLVVEISLDHSYTRLALLATIPPIMWVAFFFFQAIIGNLFQIFGPISQVQSNTKYYSGLPPKRLAAGSTLPHVTIQCPVYKEGLDSVIAPTVYSIKAAISTYEMQGGTANIFINDDGMQLLSRDEARARQDFYEEHSIGWVARPRHDPKGEHGPAPFLRRGKFKKASNMNYALWVSNRVEEKMSSPDPRPQYWTQEHEAASYVKALEEVIKEDENRTWADGNVRMGDFILLIDSDTRVPTDCLIDAVSEMTASPQVAIIQYSSGVMNVTKSFFENGITFFTNMVYTQIKYAIANGDVAPFVGHNAILRWSAVQDIAYDCSLDLKEKYWSEETVSEDFDMALRLQTAGYLVRFASYAGDGFKEGFRSPSTMNLLAGKSMPMAALFRSFIMSGMPFPSKLTILSYIGTYYAIGSAWLLTLVNYFIVGWYNTILDKYYLDSFKVYLSIIVVFTGLGNLALAILRYRIGEKSLLSSLVTNFMWIPLITTFLGGLSLHVSQALLSHLVGIDMNWGATSKEAENTTFFQEVPKVIKKFKITFLFCIGISIGMVMLACVVPDFWRIDQFFAIYPLVTIVVHLDYAPPKKVYPLADLKLEPRDFSTPIAATAPFQLLSEEGVLAYRRALFAPDVLDECAVSPYLNTLIVRDAAKKSKFLHDFWNHPDTLRILSGLMQAPLVPIFKIEEGFVSVQTKSSQDIEEMKKEVSIEPDHRLVELSEEERNADPLKFGSIIPWHFDSYPYACIIMLSHTDGMVGGETFIKCGDGTVTKVEGPKYGCAYIIQGGILEHLASRGKGVKERIASVVSFRANVEGFYDISFTTNTRPMTNTPDLHREWAEYRLNVMKKEIEATLEKVKNDQISTEDFHVFAKRQVNYMQQTYRQMVPRSLIDQTIENHGNYGYYHADRIWEGIRNCDGFETLLAAAREREDTWEPCRDYQGDLAASRLSLKKGEVLQGQLGRVIPTANAWQRYSMGDELLRQGQRELFLGWSDYFGFSSLFPSRPIDER
ncbi:hypothetical protein KCU78_g3175, partial [Aureobasidium melanogenum]